MTGPPAQVTEPGPLRQVGAGIGRAAVLIGGITVLARLVGFGRQLVFAHTVGNHCLGTAYATANQVPNIIYDIVLGGALTSAVVPVLAVAAAYRTAAGLAGPAGPLPTGTPAGGPAAARAGARAEANPGADAEASRIASALLTWTVVLLVPVSILLVLVAGPLTSLLLAGAPRCDAAATQAVSARMLVVFAPQILLYGLAVVLYGILQAHRRFTAPALAPVISSLVVIAAYVAFVPLRDGAQTRLTALTRPAELVLSIGTTAGVAALVFTALGPALRLRLRLRPALRFPDGVARRVRGLAGVGVAALIAQDASLVAIIVLANGHGGQGALVLYNYGWQMFFVPYAVLAVPIATSAFPVLSAGDGAGFDHTAASSTRAVMLVSWLGAALLAGAAIPAARLFVSGPGQARQLAITFALFAPGLIGYGLAANASRVLFACHRSRLAAIALVSGWLAVIVTDLAAVPAVAPRWVVPVLALGNTVGLTLAGLALLAAVRHARGPAALRGSARAAAAGLAGALAGAAAGGLVSAALPATGFLPNAGVAALACLAAAAVFGAVVVVLDGKDLRALAARARARLRRRPA
ncbi:MAG TPA: lipid II flippase MurJ [Streptosporangiaceae bacterium]|nr:lipid II flippase MurJ [Streptosporangiaceae bacterium]